MAEHSRRVVVTGAAGFLGHSVVERLAARSDTSVTAIDIRAPEMGWSHDVDFRRMDIRDPALAELLTAVGAESVVHLASVVTPPPGMSRETLYDIDVNGSRNLLAACTAAGVAQLVVTSSGAAYGYHRDNPVPLTEDAPLRGNEAFAYSDHKRRVEELLAEYRTAGRGPAQLILRPGTVLGESVRNQITALFEARRILGVTGSDSPFVFIWDTDVIECIARGVLEQRSGIFNLAGDGTVTLREIARLLNKPFRPLPTGLIRLALGALRPLRLSRYGPEQVDFLRYRPVLANDRLKQEFGYTPRYTSREAFLAYATRRGLIAPEDADAATEHTP